MYSSFSSGLKIWIPEGGLDGYLCSDILHALTLEVSLSSQQKFLLQLFYSFCSVKSFDSTWKNFRNVTSHWCLVLCSHRICHVVLCQNAVLKNNIPWKNQLHTFSRLSFVLGVMKFSLMMHTDQFKRIWTLISTNQLWF